MRTALIGHTGFIGSNLARQFAFDECYNSKSIGGIRGRERPDPPGKPDSLLDPDAIAQSFLHFLQQQRSAWAWEIELRPWVERF